MRRPVVLLLWSLLCCHAVAGWLPAQDANRLTYLDAALDPYYVHGGFPRLTTPQWTGQQEVDAVVVLAIDDMRDSARYEAFLRPILDRLKQIDGRAAVSIMTNRADPHDLQLASWLKEGLSIEVHTYDHPCPCLQGGDFAAARGTYERCVDLLAQIPGNRPVAYRMPCCDSLNTPSPRFWAEIFNGTTGEGNFLSIDSSVFQVFTAADSQLPRDLVLREDGSERFRHYLPFPSFVNTIENYPYPYVIGGKCWQFPCMVPSDWEAQHVQRPNNPDTVRDWTLALDATVLKQGVFNLVFHPHNWIRSEQVVELIDHAQQQHGDRVRFLNFAEADAALRDHLLGGETLRDAQGNDNGVRLLDLNNDGYLDVVIGNDRVQQTRLWQPLESRWTTFAFPTQLVRRDASGVAQSQGLRFGIDDAGVYCLVRSEHTAGGWRFTGEQWAVDESLLQGAELDGQPIFTARQGRDQGVRLRDVDHDGNCELIVGMPQLSTVLTRRDGRWQSAGYKLPEQTTIVDSHGRDAGLRFVDIDGDGIEDVLFSDAQRYSLHLWRNGDAEKPAGWTVPAQQSLRAQGDAIPMIVREGTNNGAWFHSGHMWVQNEDTNRLPDHVDRRSYRELLGQQANFPPPRSIEQSLQSMHVRPGMKIELVAAEPLIMDPVAFDWGADGRLWVVEMGDYPLGAGKPGEPGGRIKVLSDTDGDGRYDKSITFLQGLHYPTGIKVWRDGVLITCAPDILFAQDVNGDGVADMKTALYEGFVEGNQQHRVNGLRWGLDNWLYVANGDSGGVIRSSKTGDQAAIGGRDLRIRPDQGQLQAESGQTQFGRDRDDWGNWFGGNNSNPMWHYVLSDPLLRRNPHWTTPDSRRHVPQQPGAAPVFPRSHTLTRFNDFNMANRFTSACSPTIYRDQLLGEAFYGNAFICEPVHNLVNRQVLRPQGVSFRSTRADDEQDREFLASDDNWFRPVMVRTGPDGALWIADMYRLVIEHPEWIPQTWQEQLDLRSGWDRGRIYRVYPADHAPPLVPRLNQLGTAELVAQLESSNGWVRDMAQQMLLWKNDPASHEALSNLALRSDQPLARLHALCTLDGLQALESKELMFAVREPHAGVRRHAVRLAGPRAATDPEVLAALIALGEDDDPGVIFELLIALGEVPQPTPLAAIASRFVNDADMLAAYTSSLREENLAAAMSDALKSATTNGWEQPPAALLSPIVRYATASKNAALVSQLLEAICKWTPENNPTHIDTLRHGSPALRAWRLNLLAELREQIPHTVYLELPAADRQRLADALQLARDILLAADSSLPEQLAAIRLLAAGGEKQEVLDTLARLLAPQYAPELQRAAVQGLARFADDEVADLLLANWNALTPSLRSAILDALLTRTTWTRDLLQAIEQQRLPAAQLDAARRQQLLQHRAPDIRQAAEKILAATSASSNRAEVLQQFADVRQLSGDAVKGRVLFTKHCAACHRLEDGGHAVGPDLTALSDRSVDAMLVAVMDPNRAVEDKFLEYLAELQDGRIQRGMLANESSNSITLVGQEAKQFAVLRSELESLTTTGKSMMPEGIEKEVASQDLADLFAYVRSVEGQAKTFPGNEPKTPHVRDDGSIRMLATDCRIYGPSVVFEPLYRNLGFWSSPHDRAVWDLQVPIAGRYRVVLDYACHDDTAGNHFVVEVAGQTIKGEVRGTGTWDQYRRLTAGEVMLPEGSVVLTFRSDGPIDGYLIDLREIVLSPLR